MRYLTILLTLAVANANAKPLKDLVNQMDANLRYDAIRSIHLIK